MSIIYGYINLDSKPVERSVLETMKHAMDFWGPDGEGLWIENTCGIGNLLYHNTPEAIFEKMPFTDASGNLVLSAGARIDNREELYSIFNVPLGQRLTMPDSALMLKAYEKWGENCADHMVGDWAMALWDKMKRKLFIARDHHGITALYYYKGEDFFVFSSSLKGILCLPQVPKKLNEYKIAQLLVNWNEGGPTTCYLDIMRLPPAHTLTLTNGKLTTIRYWYLEYTPEIRLKNDQEYADMFLHLYTEAVRHRLRSHRPVGATLSSGLDSGSVCILAAKELAKEGKRLPAYTAVPLYDVPAPSGRIGDEGPYALALAQKLGNVDVTLCNAENMGVLEGIRKKMLIHDQPIFSAINAHWIVDILECVVNDSIPTLLFAQFGNLTISWPTQSIIRNKSLIGKLKQIKYLANFYSGNWKNNILLDKSLVNYLKIDTSLYKQKAIPYFSIFYSSDSIRHKMLGFGKSDLGDIYSEINTFFKMDIRDPTIDLNLISFLFKLPYTLAPKRTLFNNCFQKNFDDQIIERKLRGVQASDISRRISQQEIEEIKELLNKETFFFAKKNISKMIQMKKYGALLNVYKFSLFLTNL